MIGCTALRSYDTSALKERGEIASQQADKLEHTASATRQQAGELSQSWSDSNGQTASGKLSQRADELHAEEERLRGIAPILADCVQELTAIKQSLSQADAASQANQYLTVDDHGRVGFTDKLAQLEADKRPEQYANADKLQHQYFQALDAASRADEKAALALYALRGIAPPFQAKPDTGPVDLSDEAIADQLANSKQGRYGDCYFLSSLTAIARANPQFIRDHIKWDPKTGKYTVTIYENAIFGVVERKITVDPKEVAADTGHTHGPKDSDLNFLSIYEAAYRKSVHGSIFTNTGCLPSAAMLAITGNEADFTLLKPHSFDEIRKTLNAKPPGAVAVGTNTGPPLYPDPAKQPFENRIVPHHAYSVKGFDEQGRIILANTWGPNGGTGSDGIDYPGEVHLTEEEFRKFIMQSSRTVP